MAAVVTPKIEHVLIGTGAILGTAGLAYGITRAIGAKVVVYDPTGANGYFASITRNDMPGWHKYQGMTIADIEAAVSRHSLISRLVSLGHGGDCWMFDTRSGLTCRHADRFADAVSGRLVPGSVIGLGGCSSARSLGEPSQRSPHVLQAGGAQSLAGALRDAISERGVHLLSEIRAHSTRGPVTANPYGRVFRIGRMYVGRPGTSIVRGDYNSWHSQFAGERAQNWLFGS